MGGRGFRGDGVRRWTRAAGIACFAGALLGLPALVIASEPTRAELLERIERLEQIIRDAGLDKPAPARRAAPRARAPAPVTRTAPPADELDKPAVEAIVEEKLRKQKVLAGWKDGFFLESPNGDFKLKLRGYMQTQARFFPLEEGDTGTDSIFMRRVRPIVEGTVFKYFDFKIMPDFGQGTATLQDGYMDVTYFKPYAVLRAGKDKVPFSLERLQSGADLLFVERSIANNLSPNRDVGFRLSGDVLDGVFQWQAGIYNGVPDGQSSDGNVGSSSFEGAFRGFLTPFKNVGIEALEKASLGMAATVGSQKGTDSLSDNLSAVQYRTAGRATFFRYRTSTSSTSPITVFADGEQYRLSPQGYWYWGPFGLMGEYIYSQQGALRTATSDDVTTTTKGEFANQGWFVQASYVLTGEDASYRTVVPINPFDPYNGRWGAFELAARGSIVNVDPELFRLGFATEEQSTTKATNWGIGANWYFNKNFKLQADWEHTEFANEIEFGDDFRDHEDVILFQFQISY